MGNYFWAPETEFSGRIPAFYSAGHVGNTGRLLGMLPGIFLMLSGTVSRFSRVLFIVSIFRAANQFSLEGQK